MDSDDGDVLAELLRFVDEFSDGDQSAPVRASQRRSRRGELTELRVEIERLERILATAHARRSTTRTGDDLTQLAQLWRSVKDHQVMLERQARRENKELREALSKTRRFLRGLDRVMSRAVTSLPALPDDTTRAGSLPMIPPMIHARYLGRVFSDAARASAVGSATYRGDKREFRFARTEDLSALVKEVEVIWTLPFPVDDLADAVWHETTRMSTLETEYAYTDLLETPGTLVSKVIGTPKLFHDVPAMSGQIATRRVRLEGEHESQVIVCDLYMLSEEALMHGDGCIRVEPVECGGHNVSRIYWCQQIHMRPTPTKPGQSNQARQEAALTRLHNSFVSGARREKLEMNLQHRLQGIENRLITPARLQRTVTLMH